MTDKVINRVHFAPNNILLIEICIFVIYIAKLCAPLIIKILRNYICPGGDESTGPCPIAPADRNILYENRLLGLPR